MDENEPNVPDPGEVAEAARAKLGEPQPDLEARLAELERQTEQGRAHMQKAMPKPEDARAQGMSGEDARGLGVGLTVAYAILGVPLVLFGVGFLVDKAVGKGQLFQGALGLLGCALGVGYAIYAVNRQPRP